MGADRPKQYLRLGRCSMLEHSLAALSAAEWITQVLVVVAPDDTEAAQLLAGRERVVVLAAGGATRRDTVLAGLHALARAGAGDQDWVLVHDAARPALDARLLERLRDGVADSPVGGLLALPVSDTVKRASTGSQAGSRAVAATVDRTDLWLAQTPQMFRLALLLRALSMHSDVTDEASAIERAGHAPLLIEGARMNFKVTDADDLEAMRHWLERR